MIPINKKNNAITIFVLASLIVASFYFVTSVFADEEDLPDMGVTTAPATQIDEDSALLHGAAIDVPPGDEVYTWFEWGINGNYEYDTPHVPIDDDGPFCETLTNLVPGEVYHYRAAAQYHRGITFGPDMYFTCDEPVVVPPPIPEPEPEPEPEPVIMPISEEEPTLLVEKTVMNLTSNNNGYSDWSKVLGTDPDDMLSFMITLEPQDNDVHDVIVTDALPYGLLYRGNLIVSGAIIYSGADITTGISFPVIKEGQTVTITYQAQVAPEESFNLGTTNLNNVVTVATSDIPPCRDNTTVIVNCTTPLQPVFQPPQYYYPEPTNVSTGLTNNFLTDSFFLPLAILLMSGWLFFSGRIYKFADWLKLKSIKK